MPSSFCLFGFFAPVSTISDLCRIKLYQGVVASTAPWRSSKALPGTLKRLTGTLVVTGPKQTIITQVAQPVLFRSDILMCEAVRIYFRLVLIIH